jgi:NTE family protein
MAGEAGGDQARKVGLVLAGGGARGAYELGALRRLLPRLRDELHEGPDWRPDVIVGTSVGAINAAYLAATAADPLGDALENGCDIWRELHWRKALESLISVDEAAIVGRVLLPRLPTWSLLDSGPLRKTLREGPLTKEIREGIRFEQIHANVGGAISTAAVVATRASTSLSVVFHDGYAGDEPPRDDKRRGISFAQTELALEHVLSSAAIPSAFPAIPVAEPEDFADWYSDGGTRLNTPIKPALALGATHIVVVALNSPYLGDTPQGHGRPDLVAGAGQLLQGVLVDPLVNDIHTLTKINGLLSHRPSPTGGDGDEKEKVVPYILIAPDSQHAIGKEAAEVFHDRYAGIGNIQRRYDSIAQLGRRIGVKDRNDGARGELLSYLLFDGTFADTLIRMGESDADAWFDDKRLQHDDWPWRTTALPERDAT